MFDPRRSVRSNVRAMAPYQPIRPYEILAEDLGLRPDQIVKLDANENPYGPPRAVRKALAELRDVHIYPDPESRRLRRALAEQHGVPYESLLAGAGADELIDLTMRLVIEPGDRIVICPPTFGMYAFDGQLNAAEVVQVPRRSDFQLDLPALTEAVEQHSPKLILLAQPNNPDGSLIGGEALSTLLSLPTLLLFDEAYIEFADRGRSLLREVPDRSNLIVLRTLSKWAGLAGLRVGYGAFPDELLPELWKIKQPYSVSVAASQAGLAALDSRDQLRSTGEKLIAERQRLFRGIQEISYLDPFPSQANFVLARVTGRSAAELQGVLMQDGIMIRYFDKPALRDCVRISAGRPEDTDRVLAALKGLE